VPVGLYTRKGANGRRMFFRDGKLISEKSYKASKARTRSTRKGQPRKTARRAYKKNNPKRSNYMKKGIPHPSVTGMASGLAIAAYLNAGKSFNGGKMQGEGVIKDITDGQLGQAFGTLAGNAMNMIGTDTGRKTLVTAGGIALLGAFARKQFPQLKLGGNSLYFRI